MAAFLANQVSIGLPECSRRSLLLWRPRRLPAFTKNSPWQFSPNVGLSFDPIGNGKTVIRAGAELAYDQVNFFTAQRNQQNPPFATAISQTQTSTSGPISFSSPWSVGQITTNPFPQPVIPTPATAQFFAQSQFIVLPTQFHPSYTDTVDRQRSACSFRRTGSSRSSTSAATRFMLPWVLHSVRPSSSPESGVQEVLVAQASFSQVQPESRRCSRNPLLHDRQSDSALLSHHAESRPGQSVLGGGGGSVLINYNGMANYNGLITTIQHRLSSDFSLLANYTWSKCLNLADAQGDLRRHNRPESQQPRIDYGPCGSDFRNVENVVFIAKSNFSISTASLRCSSTIGSSRRWSTSSAALHSP